MDNKTQKLALEDGAPSRNGVRHTEWCASREWPCASETVHPPEMAVAPESGVHWKRGSM